MGYVVPKPPVPRTITNLNMYGGTVDLGQPSGGIYTYDGWMSEDMKDAIRVGYTQGGSVVVTEDRRRVPKPPPAPANELLFGEPMDSELRWLLWMTVLFALASAVSVVLL